MRIKSKTVMDQMNAEKPDDVLADLEAKHGSSAPSGSAAAPYIPAQCLREEVRRFKATNRFTPMDVTGFYIQAAVVLDEHESMLKTLQRIDKLCGAYCDLDETQKDREAMLDAAWTVIKQVYELAVVELARIPQPPNL